MLADSSLMVLLFQNLAGNTITFRGDHAPEIHIGASESEEEWLVVVRDNGIAIPEAQTDKIFEVFKRLHGRSGIPGTGIGLAVCRRIADHHQGRIWATSQVGEGSTFCFSLPKNDEDAA